MSSRTDVRTRDGDLAVRYATTRDRRLRDELVTEHLALADALAARYRDRGEQRDDLQQVAYLGLLKAVDRFDPTTGHAFPAFAAATIRGELRRHFRDATWTVHVPRRLQELLPRVRRAVADLEQLLRRPPGVDEVASELGVGHDLVLEALAAGTAHRTAPLEVASDVDDEDPMVGVEQRLDLATAIAALEPRDRELIVQRFVEGCTQSVIADRLGISQVHVSRLLSRAVDRMRAQLAA